MDYRRFQSEFIPASIPLNQNVFRRPYPSSFPPLPVARGPHPADYTYVRPPVHCHRSLEPVATSVPYPSRLRYSVTLPVILEPDTYRPPTAPVAAHFEPDGRGRRRSNVRLYQGQGGAKVLVKERAPRIKLDRRKCKNRSGPSTHNTSEQKLREKPKGETTMIDVTIYSSNNKKRGRKTAEAHNYRKGVIPRVSSVKSDLPLYSPSSPRELEFADRFQNLVDEMRECRMRRGQKGTATGFHHGGTTTSRMGNRRGGRQKGLRSTSPPSRQLRRISFSRPDQGNDDAWDDEDQQSYNPNRQCPCLIGMSCWHQDVGEVEQHIHDARHHKRNMRLKATTKSFNGPCSSICGPRRRRVGEDVNLNPKRSVSRLSHAVKADNYWDEESYEGAHSGECMVAIIPARCFFSRGKWQ